MIKTEYTVVKGLNTLELKSHLPKQYRIVTCHLKVIIQSLNAYIKLILNSSCSEEREGNPFKGGTSRPRPAI